MAVPVSDFAFHPKIDNKHADGCQVNTAKNAEFAEQSMRATTILEPAS
jgi:hypothetical protein